MANEIRNMEQWGVNERGEIVAATGIGSSNVTAYLSLEQRPVNDKGQTVFANVPTPVLDSVGNVQALSGPGGRLIPVAQRLQYPIRMATAGDSIANAATAATHDYTKITLAGASTAGNKCGAVLSFLSNGRIQFIGNGGISGATSDTVSGSNGLLSRDIAATSVNRRAIVDMANIGAQIVVISTGINDINNVVTAATPQASIDTLVAATAANIGIAMERIYNSGMWPFYRGIGGYSLGTASGAKTSADLAVINAALLKLTNKVRDEIIPALGFGTYIDTRAGNVDPVTGYWNAGMSMDGLHPNVSGEHIIGRMILAAIDAWNGGTPPATKKALSNGALGSANIWQNPLFLKQTSGLATGITVNSSVAGTATVTNAIVKIGSTTYQQFIITPLTLDATNQVAQVSFTLDCPIYGSTPALPFISGDLLVCECDFVLDDGAGGAPAAQAYSSRGRIIGTAGNFTDHPQIDFVQISVFTVPVAGKLKTLPLVAGEASSTMTTAHMFIQVACKTVGVPVRVLLANPNFIKQSPLTL